MSQSVKQALINFLSECITERRQSLFSQVMSGRTMHIRLILDGVHNAGDACAVMRSCECFGVQQMDMIDAHAFRPSKGIAVGASKWIDLQTFGSDSSAYFSDLKELGYRVALYTSDMNVPSIETLPLEKPIALVMASENGPSEHTRAAADHFVRLPTVGFTQSFNLSVNAALCLSSLTGRLRRSSIEWALSDGELLDLSVHWLAKMPKRISQLMDRFMEEHKLSREDLEGMFPAKTTRLLFQKG